MLGLQPRLKVRNSLWDLVNKNSPDLHSSSPPPWKQPVEEGADGLPPLPFSPSLSSPPSSEQEHHRNRSSESSTSSTMAPVSSTTSIASCGQADEANGSQRRIRRDHGRRLVKSSMVRLQLSRVQGIQELDLADCRLAQALSSPSPGTCLQEKATRIWSNKIRPVIVAENMIGCAMYELVCGSPALTISSIVLTSPQGPCRSRQSSWRGHSNRSR